jgi:hypothetical protein
VFNRPNDAASENNGTTTETCGIIVVANMMMGMVVDPGNL